MKPATTLTTLCATTAALSAFQPFSPSALCSDAPPARPNIVIIIADDLGYGDLGCYGADPRNVPTPNIDRLAAQSLRFTTGYATSATCTPSRYGLLTGEYAWRKKVHILDGDAALIIDPARPTLPAFLKTAGYTTALVGKWHLGIGNGRSTLDFNTEIKPGPLETGFDTAFFIPATVDRVPCVFIDGHHVANLTPADPIAVDYKKRIGNEPVGYEHPEMLKYPADAQHNKTIVNGISRIGYVSGGHAAWWVDEDIAATLAKHANDFIATSAAAGTPFFLYLGTHDPHVPRWPAARFRGKSGAGIRGDAIMQFDWTVGEVVAALERAGVAQNTLLIITSDNGPILFDGYHDGAAQANGDHRPAGDLRGWKYLRYEGGTRVPLLLRWPDRITPGVSDAMVSLMDLYPSIAAILNRPYPANAGRDGMNVSDALLGKTKTSPRISIVQDGIGNQLALRDGDWKYIPANARKDAEKDKNKSKPKPEPDGFKTDTRASGRVTEDLLFNLATDLGETKNLVAKNPEKLAELRAKLDAIRNTTK